VRKNARLALCLAAGAAALTLAHPAVAQQGQNSGADADLPPVTVETAPEPQAAPQPKSSDAAPQVKAKAVAKKSSKPAAKPQPPAEVIEAADGFEPSGDGSENPAGTNRVGASGVDGYLATRSSTATKTNTPLLDIPQSITVVPKELAKDQGSRDMRQALTYVPGVIVGQGEGHRDAPTIRGVSTTADFFTDGIRDDVQYFRDLYNIDVVEVLKGPNAMIFGRGGGGGVINRVTKKADGERIYEVTTTYGSFDTKRVELDAGQAITNDAAFRLNTMYEDSGSYRDFVDLERYGINPKFSFRPDADTKVHIAYEFYSDDRTVDRGIPSNSVTHKPAKTDVSQFFGNPDESYMYYRGHVANAIVEHQFAPGLMVKNHTQYGNYEKFYQNVYPTSAWNGTPAGNINLGAYNQITERESIFNQTDFTAKIDQGNGIRHTLLAGLEFGYQETDNQRDRASGDYAVPARPFNDPVSSFVPAWGSNLGVINHSELSLAGVYVQDQLALGRYVDLIGGIRFDRFDLEYTCSKDAAVGSGNCAGSDPQRLELDRVDNVWSPRAGVVFKPVEQASIYVSYGKSFLPSTGDQFSALAAGSAASGVDLQPEEFLNKEIGFKWDVTPRLAFTGALFQLDRENQRVVLPDTTVTQIGKTRTEGGELALTGYLTEAWEVVAGYGYQTAEVVVGTAAQQGHEVALVPRHTFSLWNKYHFLPNWAAGVGVLSRSAMYANVDNTVTLPGFARVDAALFWDITDNLKAQLNVENVLDTEYYSTAHNNNNITPGSPQAFFVTVTSNF